MGTIAFTNKKLTFISRIWYKSSNDTETFELADKLYHLFKEEMDTNGELKATIIAKSTRDPDKELKSINIITGNRRLSVGILESGKKEFGRQVSIDEAISDKPFKK